MIKALANSRAEAAAIADRALEFVPEVRIVDCSGSEPGFWVCFDERACMNALELADVIGEASFEKPEGLTMQTKHTPAPWINNGEGIVVHRMGDIARMESTNPADAALIAAAPDLLMALQYILRDMETTREIYAAKAPNVGVLGVSIGIARAAIERALGND